MDLTFTAQTVPEKAPKQFEILALTINLFGQSMTVVGCYRLPSAYPSTLPSLVQLLSELNLNEIILVGDFNWDWLSSVSVDFKAHCLFLSLTQFIQSPTHLNPKSPDNSSLIDPLFNQYAA